MSRKKPRCQPDCGTVIVEADKAAMSRTANEANRGSVPLEEQQAKVAEAFARKGAPDIRDIKPENLVDSPTNPRGKDMGDLSDITATAPTMGIFVPLLGRWNEANGKPGEVELVYGHRRKYGAIEVGLATVPVEIRDLTDEQVLEIQWAENGGRADVHPLREALHLKRLVALRKAPEDLAATIGRGVGYVTRRLQLAKLTKTAQKLYLAGKLTHSAADQIARLPQAKDQDKIAKWAAKEDGYGDLPSAGSVRARIKREVLLDLSRAAFSPTEPDLVAAVGPCTTCPKRTGNQSILFADVKEGDTCTDPPCFKKKAQADWRAKSKAAKAAGLKVLTQKEVKEARGYYGGSHLTGYERLDANVWDSSKGRDVKVRTLVGKQAVDEKKVLANVDGQAVELIPSKVVDAARGKKKAEKRQGLSDKAKKARKKKREENALKRRVEPKVWAELVAAAETHADNSESFKSFEAVWTIARHRFNNARAKTICARRGLKFGKGYGAARNAVIAHARSLGEVERAGLAIECLLDGFDYSPVTKEVEKVLGVDRKAIAAAEKKAMKEESKAKAKKTGKRKTAVRASKKKATRKAAKKKVSKAKRTKKKRRAKKKKARRRAAELMPW